MCKFPLFISLLQFPSRLKFLSQFEGNLNLRNKIVDSFEAFKGHKLSSVDSCFDRQSDLKISLGFLKLVYK